jgi:hypothetical protein
MCPDNSVECTEENFRSELETAIGLRGDGKVPNPAGTGTCCTIRTGEVAPTMLRRVASGSTENKGGTKTGDAKTAPVTTPPDPENPAAVVLENMYPFPGTQERSSLLLGAIPPGYRITYEGVENCDYTYYYPSQKEYWYYEANEDGDSYGSITSNFIDSIDEIFSTDACEQQKDIARFLVTVPQDQGVAFFERLVGQPHLVQVRVNAPVIVPNSIPAPPAPIMVVLSSYGDTVRFTYDHPNQVWTYTSDDDDCGHGTVSEMTNECQSDLYFAARALVRRDQVEGYLVLEKQFGWDGQGWHET